MDKNAAIPELALPSFEDSLPVSYTEKNIMMAAVDPDVAEVSTARESLLLTPLPPFRQGPQPSTSVTRCRYRLRWNELLHWNNFGQNVSDYWNTQVSYADRAALVTTLQEIRGRWRQIANYPRTLTEDDIKANIDTYPVYFHQCAANGANGAPLPSDQHSVPYRCTQGAGAFGLSGVADFVMTHIDRVTVVIEVKNPWLVTPQQIDQVIDGVAPIEGRHDGRLAVEQLYGYLVHNGKTLGILTTMKGWCFVYRTNGGIVYMTRMFGEFPARGEIQGAAAEGYYNTGNFTIMKALYYFSNLGTITNDTPETPVNGQPGQVMLPRASFSKEEAAPRIIQPHRLAPAPLQQVMAPQFGHAYSITGGYETAEDFVQFDDKADYGILQFEPWVKANYLGPKNWIAKVVSNGTKVVLKLWDAWKFDASARDFERDVYLQLKPLWGNVVPALYVSTPVEFFHGLILQYVEGSPLSPSCLTGEIENAILASFKEIHALGVIHGDVRPQNILVSEEVGKVWVIDFEFAEFIVDGDGDADSKAAKEMIAVKNVLEDLKRRRGSWD